MNTSIKEGDIVSFLGSEYIVKITTDANGNLIYSLYNFDGTLFMKSATPNLLKFVSTKEDWEKKNKSEIPQKRKTHSSSGSSSGGGYNRTRTGKNYNDTQDTDASKKSKTDTGAKDLSEKIGTTGKTKKTIADCQDMIDKAKNAISTANIAVNKWEDTKNTEGYATDASIVFLCKITDALDTLESNVNKTQVAALELNALNICLKDLLVNFAEKKRKEEEIASKQKTLDGMSPTKTVTEDGVTKEVRNDAYYTLKDEIDALKREKEAIEQEITSLQNEIDARYQKINSLDSSLLNFSSSGISVPGTNIFGTSGNTNGKSLDIDGDVIKNYMIANNLEYFEYENSLYNIPYPYDPWNRQMVDLQENYLLKYDLNKLQSYADNGNTFASGFIEYLKDCAAGNNNQRFYLDANGNHKFTANERSDIVEIFDTILEDSYISNKCSTTEDYSTTALMVLTGGFFNPRYGNNGCKPNEKGLSGIVQGADCIGVVNWAMCQGILKTNPNATSDSIKPMGLGYGVRTASDGFDGESVCDVGTVLTKKTNGHNFHTSMVIGHTEIDGVTYNVVGQTGSRTNGVNIYIVKPGSNYDTAILASNLSPSYYA